MPKDKHKKIWDDFETIGKTMADIVDKEGGLSFEKPDILAVDHTGTFESLYIVAFFFGLCRIQYLDVKIDG